MFPSNYPNNCPPDDALPPDGIAKYYRLVDEPISISDVKSKYELNVKLAKNCEDRALSMFRNLQGAKRLIEKCPWARNKKLALFIPQCDWGLLRTGTSKGSSTHSNLWLYAKTDKNQVMASLSLVTETQQ